jgi:hypothetical protein
MAERGAQTSLPLTATRSVLTVFVPGVVAISPWLLALVQHTSATLGFEEAPTLAHTMLFAVVVVVGTVCQGFGSYMESAWDKQRDAELQVTENWYAYLARPLEHEPVGYRYLSRLVTTMYFELSMAFALPFFVAGAFVLAILRFPNFYWLAATIATILFPTTIGFFCWQASDTHRRICETRREIVRRLDSYLAAPATPA